MIPGFVEISQESIALAEAEAVSAAEALGGRGTPGASAIPGLVGVEVPDTRSWGELAGRLALARRALVAVAPLADTVTAARAEGRRGGSAAFRRIGEPSGGGADATVLECGRAYKVGGGTIDLEVPSRRYWVVAGADGSQTLLEEVAAVDRAGPSLRKMPLLPFRRPVSLPPKLARAAVNLARVRTSDRILDPFLGTGALLAEAGLFGARLYGIDRDSTMVRGALQNLAYLGVTAEELLVGDARNVGFGDRTGTFSAILTDPPYGRASSTGGEDSSTLVAEVVERWCGSLAPDGRLVLIVPAGGPPLDVLGAPRFRIPVRVHRSLTREFCLYEGTAIVRRSSH
ncbi:MAG: TRM11 family SAM-dependent methyltransferase [Thermoplasmata archaeon]